MGISRQPRRPLMQLDFLLMAFPKERICLTTYNNIGREGILVESIDNQW